MSELLNLSDGSCSHKNFPLISGNAARLNEKQDGIAKQVNPQSMLSSTRSEPRLVMFRKLNMFGLKLTNATPGGEPRLRPEKKFRCSKWLIRLS